MFLLPFKTSSKRAGRIKNYEMALKLQRAMNRITIKFLNEYHSKEENRDIKFLFSV